MGIESAEMTKHAINAFLAASVVFMNEIATICEGTGADAKDVERGLKSEERIGPRAYLSPGAAFEGGTLARDVTTLAELGHGLQVPTTLITAIRDSNDRHRSWAMRKLKDHLGILSGRRVAILGLTYKPGTSTLRRSGAVALALALHAEGAIVVAFDPAVAKLPDELRDRISSVPTPADAAMAADALVLATPWPEFRALDWPSLLRKMSRPVVIDAGWLLAELIGEYPGIKYAAVGRPVLV
jgi:UDPglucose 6-dehydrogenase